MPLRTRTHPETGEIEVLVNGVWVQFEQYRKEQIDIAYANSIQFLRDRLGEEFKAQENEKEER